MDFAFAKIILALETKRKHGGARGKPLSAFRCEMKKRLMVTVKTMVVMVPAALAGVSRAIEIESS